MSPPPPSGLERTSTLPHRVAEPVHFPGGIPSLGLWGGAVTLVEGPAFCISERSGDIVPGTPQGAFFRDTRFLSGLELRVNNQRPEPLSAERASPFAGTFVLRSRPPEGQADSPLLLFRYRYVGRGMREDLVIHNYGEEAAYCSLELVVNVDFADLFDVKESRPRPDGDVLMEAVNGDLVFRYRRGAVRKGARIAIAGAPQLSANVASFELIVPARGRWSTCVQLTPIIEEEEIEPRYRCGSPVNRSTPQERWSSGGATSPLSRPITPNCAPSSTAAPRTWARCASSTRTSQNGRSSPPAPPGS